MQRSEQLCSSLGHVLHERWLEVERRSIDWLLSLHFSEWIGFRFWILFLQLRLKDDGRRCISHVSLLEASLQWIEHIGLFEHLLHRPVRGNDDAGRSDDHAAAFSLGREWVVVAPELEMLAHPTGTCLVQVIDKDSLLVLISTPPLVVLLDVERAEALTDTLRLTHTCWTTQPLIGELVKGRRCLLTLMVEVDALLYLVGVLEFDVSIFDGLGNAFGDDS